jgi:hypothetical protein
MTDIARKLDEKLKGMDAPTAAVVERLVRDALVLAEVDRARPASAYEIAAHREFLAQFTGALAGEPFQRPPHGTMENRSAVPLSNAR